jgi:hypothetical protein
MSYITSYRKYITHDITRQLNAPDDVTELCTIGDITYVSIPDDVELSNEQPSEIADSIQTVELTDELRELICKHSSHVQLINQRVRDAIAERYSVTDEIKLLRTAPSAEFDEYNVYADHCRALGDVQKMALGL